MSRRRHTSARLLIAVLASLLILGIFSAELPELLSLLDNTSNDFVVRKVSRGECAPRLTMASHGSVLLVMANSGGSRHADFAAAFVGAEVISSELFVLHSVLRR